jgi:hypothetical protein
MDGMIKLLKREVFFFDEHTKTESYFYWYDPFK